MIDISCIIINYNTTDFTKNCVQSIITNTNSNLSYEIIIIDNNSIIEEYKELEQFIAGLDIKFVKLIRSKINVGFGAGNMLGVQNSSHCKYYLFLNNDTLFIKEDTLSTVKKFMDETPDAAVCSPQMVDENLNFRVTLDHFSSIQREILKRPTLEFLFPKKYKKRKLRYKQPLQVNYVQGSFMLVSAKDFNEIGGFDTNLFLYYEESDLCYRLQKNLNKSTYLFPDLEYIHFVSASTNKNLTIKIEQKLSLIYYIRKHYSWFHYKFLLTYLCFRYFFTSIFKPKYWKLFVILLIGAPISKSLKLKQSIREEV